MCADYLFFMMEYSMFMKSFPATAQNTLSLPYYVILFMVSQLAQISSVLDLLMISLMRMAMFLLYYFCEYCPLVLFSTVCRLCWKRVLRACCLGSSIILRRMVLMIIFLDLFQVSEMKWKQSRSRGYWSMTNYIFINININIEMKEYMSNEELDNLRNQSQSSSSSLSQKQTNTNGLQYKCSKCGLFADEPTLPECCHLYCWKCLEQELEGGRTCLVCRRPLNQQKIFTIYTNTTQELNSNRELSENKPKPLHRQPIRNNNAVSSEVPFNFRLKNNINRRVNFAGYGYFPCSFIQLFNNYSEPVNLTSPQKQVKSISDKLQTILIGVVLMTILGVIMNLHIL